LLQNPLTLGESSPVGAHRAPFTNTKSRVAFKAFPRTIHFKNQNAQYAWAPKWGAMRPLPGFSKLETMHDTVIGLLINKVEFGLDIHAKLQI